VQRKDYPFTEPGVAFVRIGGSRPELRHRRADRFERAFENIEPMDSTYVVTEKPVAEPGELDRFHGNVDQPVPERERSRRVDLIRRRD
jgi:hypothetical protein